MTRMSASPSSVERSSWLGSAWRGTRSKRRSPSVPGSWLAPSLSWDSGRTARRVLRGDRAALAVRRWPGVVGERRAPRPAADRGELLRHRRLCRDRGCPHAPRRESPGCQLRRDWPRRRHPRGDASACRREGSRRREARLLGNQVRGSANALCAYLAAALLIGLGANAIFGWWWADPVTALLIAGVALNEGREAWAGTRAMTAASHPRSRRAAGVGDVAGERREVLALRGSLE